MTSEKRQAHELIDQLDESQINAALRLLESMVLRTPSSRPHELAVDEEHLSDETRQAIESSEIWFREHGGKGIPMQDILAEFGLSLEDFPLDSEQNGSPR
jgi:hypothetical protein